LFNIIFVKKLLTTYLNALRHEHPHIKLIVIEDGLLEEQLFPLTIQHKENQGIQRSLKISFRKLFAKLQCHRNIN